MTSLAFLPVVTVVLCVIAIEFMVFDIIETIANNYDDYMNGNEEAGTQVKINAAINVITFGVTKIGGAIISQAKNASNCAKYGKNVINGLKNSGFTTAEVNAQISKFSKLGCSQSTIETLLKNPKCMFLGDDVLSFLGKQGGNQRLLAELVIGNGDDFTKALMNTGALDDFCNLVWKYGGEAAKVLVDKGDDAVRAICNLDALQASRLVDITSKNGHLSNWSDLIVESGDLSYKGANIYDSKGLNLTELDEVDFTKKIIYEDKNATGLYIEKPDVPLTEQQWAEKQILVKGGKRVAALQNDNLKVTIETKSGEVLDCSFTVPELKEIEDYVFRINADTPELRIAVEDCLNELQAAYPNMNFSAIFGG